MDRPTVYRAGKSLLQAKVLACDTGRLAIQIDDGEWDNHMHERGTVGARQLWITEVGTLSGNNATVGWRQRNRCHRTTLFRRAKDSSKDKKTVVGASSVDNQNGERRIYQGTDQCPTPIAQVMDHYIALNGNTLTQKQTVAFHRKFGKSAETLLEACSGNVQQAKEAITQAAALDGCLTI